MYIFSHEADWWTWGLDIHICNMPYTRFHDDHCMAKSRIIPGEGRDTNVTKCHTIKATIAWPQYPHHFNIYLAIRVGIMDVSALQTIIWRVDNGKLSVCNCKGIVQSSVIYVKITAAFFDVHTEIFIDGMWYGGQFVIHLHPICFAKRWDECLHLCKKISEYKFGHLNRRLHVV